MTLIISIDLEVLSIMFTGSSMTEIIKTKKKIMKIGLLVYELDLLL